MGIKGFKTLVQKCYKGQRIIPLSVFRGKRIAIDAGTLMIKYIARVWSKEVDNTNYPNASPNMTRFIKNWLGNLRKNAEDFIMAGITPVYVFDGKAPKEKAEEKARRNKERKRNEEKYQEIYSQLSTAFGAERESLITELKKKAKCLFPCGPEIKALMKDFYANLGIPVLQCTEEAERLCAKLCLDGYCSAVFSTDRDTLVHGCPITIIDVSGSMMHKGRQVKAIEVLDLLQILRGLNLNYTQFVDLCIMCGCDYNKNIPYIGATRAYELIDKYRSIEAVPNDDINKYLKIYVNRNPHMAYLQDDPKAMLKIESCRRRFAAIDILSLLSPHDLEVGTLNKLSINKMAIGQQSADFFAGYQIENWLHSFITLYGLFPQIGKKDGKKILPPNIMFSITIKPAVRFIWGIDYVTLWSD